MAYFTDSRSRLKLIILLLQYQKNLRNINSIYLEESDEEEACLESLLQFEFTHRCRGQRKRALKLLHYAERIVPAYDFNTFRSHFRIMPATVEALENKISPFLVRQGPVGRFKIPPRKQILSVLWLLATPDSYRSVAEQFGMSKSTLHHCFRRVIYRLNYLVKSQIYWPQRHEAEIVQQKFFKLSGMPNVIGAIDGCHVEIDAPKKDAAAYRTGKKKYAIQLQAVCTTNLIFTDVFAGYPASVHDARVFKNSPLFRDCKEILVGEEYIVADKAYPLLTWCIPPYKNLGNLREAELTFNKKLSQARQIIERSFCLLKGRFRRLKHLVMLRTDEISLTIMAACVLHNMCLRGLHEHQEDIEEYVREGQEQQLNYGCQETESTNTSLEAINKRSAIRDMVAN